MKRWARWEDREERKLAADQAQHQPGVLFLDQQPRGPDLASAALGVLQVPYPAARARRPPVPPAVPPTPFSAAAGQPAAPAEQAGPSAGSIGGAAPAQGKALSAPAELPRMPATPQLHRSLMPGEPRLAACVTNGDLACP
jgi:hypothetical protein